MLKKLLAITGLVLATMVIAACTGNETPKKTEAPNHQTQEKVDAKGLEINIEQANYTDERDRDAEKVKQVLRLKMTVKNTSIEEIFFDSTELQVKDSKGKKLAIYPFENMMGNITPKKTMTGYAYFKATDNGPYTVVYTHPITKKKYEWQVNPEK
ncbi:DUF4352 domain-containing protein [Listeria booriae]|uniref:DUF4352 domain-containing protein n=1 Tax=Listeria booriae TaxID=1552123 RepID=A0A7X1CCY2_9LIST|nr:DUF4352 domain-containing protein [Listeria booriae]MBC1492844.1 DUF4352 domain-containing protein [Listeria booriae]MBC1503437.1 DUF4352 domain-containing protein [Listeria booriae]MBC2258035.1 DUF4352 domain-containing protein [Listeria booriae]MBC6135077.1 DUF4352 domain-containing protein [Listeria booriae]